MKLSIHAGRTGRVETLDRPREFIGGQFGCFGKRRDCLRLLGPTRIARCKVPQDGRVLKERLIADKPCRQMNRLTSGRIAFIYDFPQVEAVFVDETSAMPVDNNRVGFLVKKELTPKGRRDPLSGKPPVMFA